MSPAPAGKHGIFPGHDSMTIMLNGPVAVDTAALPWIAMESSTNQKSSLVNLATYLPQGLDADTATWQRISIPLTAFQPYGTFLLAQFKDFWFSQRSGGQCPAHDLV